MVLVIMLCVVELIIQGKMIHLYKNIYIYKMYYIIN